MLNTTPEPEEFLLAPTALPDPPGEDHASNDGSTGGLIPLNFTSDGESSMDIEMYQLHIQTTNSLLQGIGGCTQTMPQNSLSAIQEPVLKAPTTPEIKQCDAGGCTQFTQSPRT